MCCRFGVVQTAVVFLVDDALRAPKRRTDPPYGTTDTTALS